MPHLEMAHDVDPRQTILDAIGDLSNFELFHNQVLLATYIRPAKAKSGLILTDDAREEDKYQGKIGLLVKMGPQALVASENWFTGLTFTPGKDWLLYRPSDGWGCSVNRVSCRVLDDILVRGRVEHPDTFY